MLSFGGRREDPGVQAVSVLAGRRAAQHRGLREHGGGTLVIGVENDTRSVVGVDDALALEDKLANLISDRITPTLVPDIEVLQWRVRNVLPVQV